MEQLKWTNQGGDVFTLVRAITFAWLNAVNLPVGAFSRCRLVPRPKQHRAEDK